MEGKNIWKGRGMITRGQRKKEKLRKRLIARREDEIQKTGNGLRTFKGDNDKGGWTAFSAAG